mgnify:CR=1 FL=1
MPRSIREGEEVLAGMIVQGQAVRIQVNRPYEQSALARILALVKDASERKAPAELFIRRFARIYTRTDLYPNRDSSVVSNRVGSSLGRDGDAFFPVCFLGLVI